MNIDFLFFSPFSILVHAAAPRAPPQYHLESPNLSNHTSSSNQALFSERTIQMDSLPPGSAVLEDGIAQDPANWTGKSPAVLVDGIVQDPRQQKEVNAETNVHAPVTKNSVKLWRGKKCIKFKLWRGKKYKKLLRGMKSKKLLRGMKSKKLLRGNTLDMVTPKEEAQRLVLENRKLMERISELRTLNTKVNDEIAELLEQYSADWKSWANGSNLLADGIREMARSTGKISAVLEDGIAQDPQQLSEVSWFIYKADDAETDGHVPVTERLSRGNILYMVTVEETQQLILENGKLNKRVIELLNLNAKAKDKFTELQGKKMAERKKWTQRFLKLAEERARMVTEFLMLEQSSKYGGEGVKMVPLLYSGESSKN